ncbi:MFS transporter [Actinomadura sp. CNU-125]|uniref:MFS transporter n=1 Tax=Actinomadura sp. CNU-125 TaxID=1904961 RepID=UPI0009FB83CB|nr:MFS transporter [Actinomadura sp. CNU-125]
MIALVAIEIFAVFETAMALAAIPTFMRVFEADSAAVGWTGTAYLLVGAVSAATAGRLGDIFGRRNVLVTVLAIAAVGSLISVLASSLWLVILGRGVQGMAAGALPLSFGLVRELLPERRVPFVMSLLGGVVPVCTGAGSLIAGVLIDHGGWRNMFVAATAMGVAATLIALLALPRTPGITPRPSVDVVGAVLLAPAVGGILLGVSQSEDWGWSDPRVILAILVGVAVLATWIWWERRVPDPLVSIALFRNRKVALATAAAFMVGAGPMGAVSILAHMVLQLPETAPVGLGLSPTDAGYVLFVVAIVAYAGAIASGRIAQKMGARPCLVLGTLIYALGIFLWMFLDQSIAGTMFCLALTGLANGFALTALPILVVEAVPVEHTGEATGVNRVTLNTGVACGLAITSVILATSTVEGTHMPTHGSFVTTVIVFTCLSLVGTVLALLIRGGRTTVADEPEATPAKV